MTISREDLAHAVDNSTPYPMELHSEVCLIMADQLLTMLHMEKNEEHLVWQPETEELVSVRPIEMRSDMTVEEQSEPGNDKVHPDFAFQRALQNLINEHGLDVKLSVPDYLLTNYIWDSINTFTNLKVGLLNHGLGQVKND